MKFLTFSTIIFGVIVISDTSTLPQDKYVYSLDRQVSKNIYISLLPERISTISSNSIDFDKDALVDSLQRQKIKEIVKEICREAANKEEDLMTCAIKAVTTFIACMHVDKDGAIGEKETTEVDPFKCLIQAFSIFVKCLISKQHDGLANYNPDVVMHMK